MAGWSLQGRARVETDMRRPDDEGVVAEAWIQRRVRNQEDIASAQGMSAEGDLAAGFANIEADPRGEDLPVPLHQGDESDRHVEKASRESDDASIIRVAVIRCDAVLRQCREPRFFVDDRPG